MPSVGFEKDESYEDCKRVIDASDDSGASSTTGQFVGVLKSLCEPWRVGMLRCDSWDNLQVKVT